MNCIITGQLPGNFPRIALPALIDGVVAREGGRGGTEQEWKEEREEREEREEKGENEEREER